MVHLTQFIGNATNFSKVNYKYLHSEFTLHILSICLSSRIACNMKPRENNLEIDETVIWFCTLNNWAWHSRRPSIKVHSYRPGDFQGHRWHYSRIWSKCPKKEFQEPFGKLWDFNTSWHAFPSGARKLNKKIKVLQDLRPLCGVAFCNAASSYRFEGC